MFNYASKPRLTLKNESMLYIFFYFCLDNFKLNKNQKCLPKLVLAHIETFFKASKLSVW